MQRNFDFMRKVSSIIKRNHRGGVFARIKWIRWLLGYGLLASALLFVFSIVLIFSAESVSVPVLLPDSSMHSAQVLQETTSAHSLSSRLRGDLLIQEANFLDRMMLSHADHRAGWAGSLFWGLICWFSLRILNELNLTKPFQLSIRGYINALVSTIYAFLLFQVISRWYAYAAVRDVNSALIPDMETLQSNFSGYLILALLLSVFAYIYSMGCRMQEDQDLIV